MKFNTSKESAVAITFNDAGWGNVSGSFTKSVMRITHSISQFEKIEMAAKEFTKGSTQIKDSVTTTDTPCDAADNDDQANLTDYASNKNTD